MLSNSSIVAKYNELDEIVVLRNDFIGAGVYRFLKPRMQLRRVNLIKKIGWRQQWQSKCERDNAQSGF
jgi:hypothetical protein